MRGSRRRAFSPLCAKGLPGAGGVVRGVVLHAIEVGDGRQAALTDRLQDWQGVLSAWCWGQLPAQARAAPVAPGVRVALVARHDLIAEQHKVDAGDAGVLLQLAVWALHRSTPRRAALRALRRRWRCALGAPVWLDGLRPGRGAHGTGALGGCGAMPSGRGGAHVSGSRCWPSLQQAGAGGGRRPRAGGRAVHRPAARVDGFISHNRAAWGRTGRGRGACTGFALSRRIAFGRRRSTTGASRIATGMAPDRVASPV